jgi:galactokinase
VNLVQRGVVDSLREEVLGEYRRRTGIGARLYLSDAADGARLR